MNYKENPKTKGSGILCAIPQKGHCVQGCKDCFFQSGKSYLEPLKENLPNMPDTEMSLHRVVRVNDGNDSFSDIETVLDRTKDYKMKFYNTSLVGSFHHFIDPVVLTLNPDIMTNRDYYILNPIPANLMFVRIRVNTWNLDKVVTPAINYYTKIQVPVVLTFMAYADAPLVNQQDYIYRTRTENKYWAITTQAWRKIMSRYQDNIYVYSCGKIEGEKGSTKCKFCGNCLREFFSTKERLDAKV